MDRLSPLCFVALLSACAPAHVQLPVPPDKDDAVEVRVAFYEAHRPIVISTTPPSMLLADGRRVSHVADLTSHLDADAPTVLAAARADAARADHDAWMTTGWAMAAVGGALELGGGALAIAAVAGEQEPQPLPPLALAALIGSVAGAAIASVGVVYTFGGVGPAVVAAVETETALLSYDASLRRRLALSDDDLLAARRREPAPADPPATIEDGPPLARLEVGVLPPGCPSAMALHDGVRARLGRDPFVDIHDDVISVDAVDDDAGIVVTVTLRSSGEVVGVRSQTGALAACDELMSRAALLMAVMLDPLAPATTEPTP